MTRLFEAINIIFGSIGRTAFWFIGSVVIPGTAWFVLLRVDISQLKDGYKEVKAESAQIKMEVQKEKDELAYKFERIERSLGRLEGSVQRIPAKVVEKFEQ